jgi:hypothetical protein
MARLGLHGIDQIALVAPHAQCALEVLGNCRLLPAW